MTPVLTTKQQAICDLLTHGFTSKEIGRQLGLSPRTIEDHRRKIFRKFGVHGAVGLVRKIFAGAGE